MAVVEPPVRPIESPITLQDVAPVEHTDDEFWPGFLLDLLSYTSESSERAGAVLEHLQHFQYHRAGRERPSSVVFRRAVQSLYEQERSAYVRMRSHMDLLMVEVETRQKRPETVTSIERAQTVVNHYADLADRFYQLAAQQLG